PNTPWRRALAGEPGTIIGFHENVHRRKDGTTFPVEVGVGSIDYGGRRMILASCRDITERKVLEYELAHLATHDSLTGLPNRALFLDRLEHTLASTQRRDGLVAILFLDLDNFKVVNDSLRHEVGDQLLVAVSRRLKGCLRFGTLVARMGGDEFTVLLKGISGVGDAEEVAERIIRELEAPFVIEGHLLSITASIGIALSDAAGRESGDLLRAADIALYRAKDEHKDRYEIFDPSKDAHVLERLELENDLRKAVERHELKVYYQPVFSLESDYIAGMEALLRWEHPERGSMSPTEFIPLAEETGLIVPVGRWVLEEACRQACEWQEQCPSDPPPIVGVNLSLRQFQHLGLADDVARILRETGLDPGNLALEITESVAMHDVDSTVATLEELKSLGVWLVIDDFGMGHNSVSYLTNQFKMDHLKIDGSFISEFVEDPDNSAIIPGLIDFAHAVGLRVIAEGVETADQLRRLKEMGCEFVQGTIIAEPLTPVAASELLARKALSSGGGP
ncbi:MAG: EAL domain-containing protein, partial [Actinobacteria bacterium]|nr:EAL domain-containing protein [Actinomycetota bacterium]